MGSPDYKQHSRIDAGPALPGYSGYIPGSRDKVGGSYNWTESGRRFAGELLANDLASHPNVSSLVSPGLVHAMTQLPTQFPAKSPKSDPLAGKVAGESTEDNDRQEAMSRGELVPVGFDDDDNPLDT